MAAAVAHARSIDVVGTNLTPGAGVGDVEDLAVRREAQAVRSGHLVRDQRELARLRVESIDTGRDLGFGLVAFVPSADAVDRIREPDAAVGMDHDVVWRIQTLAAELRGDLGDRAVL